MKRCNICDRSLSLDEFYVNRKAKDGRQSCCKTCRRIYLRENTERIAAVNRAYRHLQRERLALKRGGVPKPQQRRADRRAGRLRRYGLTVAEYDEMVMTQCGTCVICGDLPRRALAVDHCHVTDAVRGLLCDRCNLGLGHFMDNRDRIGVALEYLTRADARPPR